MEKETQARIKTAKILSLVVVIAGITVITGWIFDIALLKSIYPGWVSMKFDTAIAFLLSGVILYFTALAIEGHFDLTQVVLSVASLILILLMGTLFFSIFLNVRTGVEDLFIKETAGTIKTVAPGRPSLPTILNFILIAIAGIYVILNLKNLRLKLRFIGLAITVIGALAVTGYIINAPVLYYFINGLNSAMACHTAALFVLLGTGFVCLSD